MEGDRRREAVYQASPPRPTDHGGGSSPQLTGEETGSERERRSWAGLCDPRALREGLEGRRQAGHSPRLFMGSALRIWLARLGRK